MIKYTALLLLFFVGCSLVSHRNFLKEPKGICEYNDIEAGCDQLLVYLNRKDDGKIISIIEENGGHIVGQLREFAMIQVEIRPTEKLLYLKKILEESGYVRLVTFNMVSSFQLDSRQNRMIGKSFLF